MQRRASPQLFQSLLKQLSHKQEIPLQDLKNLISSTSEFEPLLVAYFTSTVVSDQTTNFNLSSVLSELATATDENQYLILNALTVEIRSEQDSALSFSTFDVTNITASLFQYLRYLLDQKQDNQALYLTFSTFLVHLLPRLIPQNPSAITHEQTDLFNTFIVVTKSQIPSLSQQLEEIFDGLRKRHSIAGSLRSSIAPSTSITNSYAQHATFLKNNKLSKYIWLHSSIMNWSTHKADFLQTFEQFVNVKTNQNILNELVSLVFEGYTITIQSIPHNSLLAVNWKLFLTKRFPLLVKQLNLKNVELSLTNALNLVDPKISQAIKLLGGNSDNSGDTFDDMFSSFPSTTTDIRHDLLRSCIATNILPQSAFKAILKQDAAADPRALPNDDTILDESGSPVDVDGTLQKTLLNINTEFIPLEDSGLLEFLKLIEEAEGPRQVEFAQLIISTIEKFISEDDISRLARLSLALGISQQTLHAIAFHSSPAALIKPIMNYLDRWQNNNDDGNFQETYTSFGCIFLLLLLTVKKFNIPLNDLLSYKESISSQSFCIRYLTNIGTSKQVDPSDMHKSEVLNSWMTALFDSGGISDDLMRLSTVQECFEIFPTIFQQVFIGCKQKLIDIETVKGGLEYFLQPFLLGTVVGISVWSENYLWKDPDSELLINLLKALIVPLDINGESIHIQKVVSSIYASDLYKVLSDIDDRSSISNSSRVDPELLSSLSQSAEDQTHSRFFELDIATINPKPQNGSDITRRYQSLLELLHSQFQVLITWGQFSSSLNFDLQSFQTLMSLLGEEIVVEYFLDQIKVTSQQNGKHLPTMIELSIYLLITHYVTFSTSSKESFIKSLKSETVGHRAEDNLSKYHHLLEVLIHKKQTKKADDDIIAVFYEKVIEITQNLNTY